MKKSIFIILFFLKVSFAFGQVSLAYIDINFILNNSLAGKSLKENINFIQNSHLEKFNKIEKDLITKENNLNSQKNIMEKKDFEKKITD